MRVFPLIPPNRLLGICLAPAPGILFHSLHPNNVELGNDLAISALGALSGEARKRGMAPLREVKSAVNLRTASHIGLDIGSEQQCTFDFVFPEP
jgi:putative ABC transport system substrate-binding protein